MSIPQYYMLRMLEICSFLDPDLSSKMQVTFLVHLVMHFLYCSEPLINCCPVCGEILEVSDKLNTLVHLSLCFDEGIGNQVMTGGLLINSLLMGMNLLTVNFMSCLLLWWMFKLSEWAHFSSYDVGLNSGSSASHILVKETLLVAREGRVWCLEDRLVLGGFDWDPTLQEKACWSRRPFDRVCMPLDKWRGVRDSDSDFEVFELFDPAATGKVVGRISLSCSVEDPMETEKNFARCILAFVDYNEDGKLSFSEFSDLIKAFGNQNEELFKAADKNGVDAVSMDELAELPAFQQENEPLINCCPVCGEILEVSNKLNTLVHLSLCFDERTRNQVMTGGFLTDKQASYGWMFKLSEWAHFSSYDVGLNSGSSASHILVMTAPMSSINAIAVEAFKKYILVSLIQNSQVCFSLLTFII
ncbi:hypothetical protein POTOM_060355 [Populus tomentosa]|uniref:EF-hand domain-containing protein n=1 Tax=Populus tomentosa TaxID=118781 RepID=A0A8X7XQN7_POPTO|nr:hypothetical protein POTOM_060355 [Populus tomentosa]